LNLLRPTASHSFRVKDFMQAAKHEPVLMRKKFDFHEAVQTIENFKTGYAIVVDENNKFVGIITNADVRKALLKNWNNLADLPYEEFINFKPISIAETDSLQTMLNLIESQNRIILFLPVVNAIGEFTGIVPLNNLAKG
ncbi:MAG TPA: CBS domain-containing protein, partial [Chitinophagales bacterium]